MFAIDRLRALGRRPSRLMIATVLGLSVAGIALAADVNSSEDRVRLLLKTRLPKTPITAIDCGKIVGLCEITAGSNLFYVDTGARFLVIGRVYDMQTRQDITAARLLEMNPDMLVGAAAARMRPPLRGAGRGGTARAAVTPGGGEKLTSPRQGAEAFARRAAARRRDRLGQSLGADGDGLHRFSLWLLPRADQRPQEYERARRRAADIGARQPRRRRPGLLFEEPGSGAPRGLCRRGSERIGRLRHVRARCQRGFRSSAWPQRNARHRPQRRGGDRGLSAARVPRDTGSRERSREAALRRRGRRLLSSARWG